jgi:hypothetical protein
MRTSPVFRLRVFPALLLIGAAACSDAPTAIAPDASLQSRAASPAVVLETPRFESRAPAYPAVAVYIVFREYAHQNPGLSRVDSEDREYQRYMEKRLRELYPARGYSGMMQDATADLRAHHRRWSAYEKGRGAQVGTQSCEEFQMTSVGTQCTGGGEGGTGYPPPSPIYYDDGSWSGQQEFEVDHAAILSVQQEADSLAVTPEEYDRLVYYESLALGNDGGYTLTGTNGLTRDDLIRQAAEGAMPGELTATADWGTVIAIPLGLGAVCGIRAVFAYFRAKSASGNYYPSLSAGDTKRDAFRHVYASVMLRRYCTAPLAKAITDVNEWGNSAWGARVMDYHNNDLGREAKYEHFRGHWFWDRWSWGVWGHRVRRYIDDPANGAFLPSLQDQSLSEQAARSIRQTVPAYMYIYFREY